MAATLIQFKKPLTLGEPVEACQCGALLCLGHEVVEGMILFPGIISPAAFHASKNEIGAFTRRLTAADFAPSGIPRG